MKVNWDSFSAVTSRLHDFSTDRAWTDLHSPEHLAKALVVEAAELLEVFLWKAPDDDYDESAAQSEVADVLIYALLTCEQLGVAPGALIEQKLHLNQKRFPRPPNHDGL